MPERDWWPRREDRSILRELFGWTVIAAVPTVVFLWETRDSPFFLIGLLIAVPLFVVEWAIGWGLIAIAMSRSDRRSQRAGCRCPNCTEPITESQQACSWCGAPLA